MTKGNNYLYNVGRIANNVEKAEQWKIDHHEAMAASDLKPIIDELTEILKDIVIRYDDWRDAIRLNEPGQYAPSVIKPRLDYIVTAVSGLRPLINKFAEYKIIDIERFEKFLGYLENELADWVEPTPAGSPGMNVLAFRKKSA